MSCKFRVGSNCEHDGKPCIYDDRCYVPNPMTNGDWLRSLEDEALAKTLEDGCPPERGDCHSYYANGLTLCWKCWLDWLKQPKEGK